MLTRNDGGGCFTLIFLLLLLLAVLEIKWSVKRIEKVLVRPAVNQEEAFDVTHPAGQ